MSFKPLADFPVSISIELQWGEMDAAQHINNAMYFRYFEAARIAYFKHIGWYADLNLRAIGPILRDTYARYKIPLHFPDTITIGAKITKLEADRFEQTYAIYSHARQMIATEGRGTIVAFNYATQEKCPLPAHILQAIQDLEKHKTIHLNR